MGAGYSQIDIMRRQLRTDVARDTHSLARNSVSSPLLASAVGPLLLIALSATGAMELPTALHLAAWLSAGSLFVWGCAAGVRMGGGWIAAVVVGLVDVAVGTTVVLVKLAAGH
jgi:hypothetical protein